MKNLRYLPITLLCLALFTGYGAKAQAESRPQKTAVPSKIEGNWALPDCRSYDEAMMITRHFYLKSDTAGSQFWPIAAFGKEKDYWVLTIEGKKHPVRVEEDGILKIGILPDAAQEPWPEEWDHLLLDGKREFMGCDDIPALLPDPLVRVMVHINAIESTCRSALTPKCKNLLFKIADNDRNKIISIKEMKMAGAMLAGLAALIENHNVSRSALDKTLYQSLRESDRIAAGIGQSKNEWTYNEFSALLAKADSAPLNAALMRVGTLFPAFIPAAAAPETPGADGHLSPAPVLFPGHSSPQSP